MRDFMKELTDMEESLWERRMKLLHQYQRVQEMRGKIAELERMFEDELGVDMETAVKFVEQYEKNPEEARRLREVLGDEVINSIEMLADRIRQIQEMKREVDDVEREVFEIDGEIDEAFEKLQEYRRRIQEML